MDLTSLILEEGFYQKFITSDKLQVCLYNQPSALIFLKNVPNFSGSISGHNLTHPGTSTSTSGAQYFHIQDQYFHIRDQYFHIRTNIFTYKVFALILSWNLSGLRRRHDRPKKLCNAISVSSTIYSMKK